MLVRFLEDYISNYFEELIEKMALLHKYNDDINRNLISEEDYFDLTEIFTEFLEKLPIDEFFNYLTIKNIPLVAIFDCKVKYDLSDNYYYLEENSLFNFLEKSTGFLIEEKKLNIFDLDDTLKKIADDEAAHHLLVSYFFEKKDFFKAEKIAEVIQNKYPDSFYARLLPAIICCNKKQYSKIARVLNNKLELQEFYPRKNNVYYSDEITVFYTIISRYYLNRNMIEKALTCYFSLYSHFKDEICLECLALDLTHSLINQYIDLNKKAISLAREGI